VTKDVVDNFCNFARDVAARHGQLIHAGRVYSHLVGHCASRAVAQGYFGAARSVVRPLIKFTMGEAKMKHKTVVSVVSALCLVALLSAGVLAQGKLKDEINQAQKAAEVFREIMGVPEKEIPRSVLDKAECVAVFPQVIKAGFIVGGRGGRGVASCRTASGWSAPAYFNLGGGSVGLQIGAQATDFVLLFMNRDGMKSLLSDNFTLGADASVAAGPVGRQAGAETDLKLDAQILSYSRSKGLFAGLELKGVVIKPAKDDMRDVYGRELTAREVLEENKVTAPEAVRVFPSTLGQYSSRAASASK
jgi:SH3 domain-containing YSC84-like protein 1